MFVQVIEGRVADREGFRRQMDRWAAELRPGATGFLGSTAGVTDDGRAVVFARFESAASAKANSDRPEQGDWWAATESCLEGEVTFTDSDEVETFLGGGSDEAGFVQVMKGRGDRDKVRGMDQAFEEYVPSVRPDLLGALRVWTGPDTYIEAAYFTNEAEAREGEQQDPPPELADLMSEFEAMMADVEFLDIRDPSFH